MKIQAINDLVLSTTEINKYSNEFLQVPVIERNLVQLLLYNEDNLKDLSITFSLDDPSIFYRYSRTLIRDGLFYEEIREGHEDSKVFALKDLSTAPLVAEVENGIPRLFDGWRFDFWNEDDLLSDKTLLQTVMSGRVHKIISTPSNKLYQEVLDEPGTEFQERLFDDVKFFFETEMSQVLEGTFLCEEQGSGFDYMFRLLYTIRKLNKKKEIFLFDLEFNKLHFLLRINLVKFLDKRFKDIQIIMPEDLI